MFPPPPHLLAPQEHVSLQSPHEADQFSPAGEGELPPPCGAPQVSASRFPDDARWELMHSLSQLNSQRSLMG